jgi:hypothetical protein
VYSVFSMLTLLFLNLWIDLGSESLSPSLPGCRFLKHRDAWEFEISHHREVAEFHEEEPDDGERVAPVVAGADAGVEPRSVLFGSVGPPSK